MTTIYYTGIIQYDLNPERPLDFNNDNGLYVKCRCKHFWSNHNVNGCLKKTCKCKRYESRRKN
jgi:hypothetical protein